VSFERRDGVIGIVDEARVRPRVRVFPVTRRDDAVLIAPQARRLAQLFGFDAKRAAEIAIVASELASNIAKHGIRGDLTIILDDDTPPRGAVTLLARDVGPPIKDLRTAATDGWDDEGPIDPAHLLGRGGLGTGLGAILRLSDRFDYQELPEGKEIVVRFFRGGRPASMLETSQGEGERRMPEAHRIGAHTTWLEEPDLIVLRLAGDVSLEDAEEINRRHFALIEGHESVYMLVDMVGLGTDTPAGRKTTSEALTRMPLRGLAVCQARMEAKVMAKMVIAGVHLFQEDGEVRFPVEYFADEAAARAWLAGLKASP
jgi:anti-sigma regulatory factor (Ser/Thr protein kinase)